MTTSSTFRQMHISFSGVDGAGKSTQIDLLQAALRRAGLRCTIVTFWDDVVALKRFREDAGHKVFRGDQGVGSPERPLQRRDKNVRSPLLDLARMGFYLLDALALRRRVRALRSEPSATRPDVIIFDRYLYDELANLPPTGILRRLYRRFMLSLTPRPDLSLSLDADPGTAFARKPEYPLEFLHLNRRAYLQLAEEAGMTVLPPGPIAEVHARILTLLGSKQEAPSPEGETGLLEAQRQSGSVGA